VIGLIGFLAIYSYTDLVLWRRNHQ
jgi:hypothetical protein